MTPHAPRHFLRDDDLTVAEQAGVLDLAARLKAEPFSERVLEGPRTVALVFDKPTLRTQSSFAVAVAEMGGFPYVVDGRLAGIGERESIADVARVLGRQVSMIVWRTFGQERIEEMAAYAGVPVVNALTDQFHPCQALADLQTVAEQRGGVEALRGMTVAYLGDAGANVAQSWAVAGPTAGMHVRVSGPTGFLPTEDVLAAGRARAEQTGGSLAVVEDPADAVAGADVLITDTWISMGREAEAAAREAVFEDWRVDRGALDHAADDALVLHCLPAYRGKEITAEVLEGPQSVVWDEAENRRHAQKALMAHLAHAERAQSSAERAQSSGPDGGPGIEVVM
ncbi:ornithine carbamoyltransferase [Nocardioidaceae bacterium]|nr:ornithine carbamoyltransferase [Nocardioidaceae bacterium]